MFIKLFILLPYLVFSQDNILKRKVSYQAENLHLESVLLGIANVGNFNFSYNPQIIPGDSSVSIKIEETTVKRVMDILFGGKIVYKVSGNHLILLREKPARSHEKFNYSVSGFVYNAATGDKLTSTTIYEVYTLASTITDDRGYYNLKLTKKYDEFGLAFSKRDFVDTLILVRPADLNLDIRLRQKWTQEELDVKQPDLQSSVKPLENISIVQRFVPRDQYVRSDNIEVIEYRPAQISLIPKIGTNTKMSGSVENSISINVFAGYSAGVRIAEIGGLLNINKRHVSGLQAAGLSNIVGGRTRGVQLAGLSNNNRGSVHGLQAAGISNMVVDTIKGVQLTGISNILQGGMKGWQIAGISNVTTKNVDGVQLSGISNFARGDVLVMQAAGITNIGRNVSGVQLAGIVNTATGKVGGAQLAGIGNFAQEVNAGQFSGIINIATKKVRGAQISAIVNYGKEINGSQFALLNLSDTVTGLPVGFISFVRRGYRRVELSANEVLYANLTLKTGVHKFYNIFTGGLVPNDTIATWGLGYGIGFEKSIGKRFLHSYDFTANWISEKDKPFGALNLLNKLRINFAYRFAKRSSVFIGPSINVHLSEWIDKNTGEFLTNIAPYVMNSTVLGDTQMQLWIAGQIGLRF
ncbi:MAG: STN domain-containing protein [Cytophagales bacterium]|nr:STN domain-containing protein [Cytophagales bacterium]